MAAQPIPCCSVENRWTTARTSRGAETRRREAAGLGAVADPVLQLRHRAVEAPAGRIPRSARRPWRRRARRRCRRPCALQPHALAARHFRDLVEREEEELPVLAERRDHVALGGDAEPHLLRRVTDITCLPLRVLASTSASGTTKPRPSVETTRSLRSGSWTKTATTSSAASMSTMSRIGSPWPRPPGSLSACERVEPPAGRGDHDLVGGLAPGRRT